MILKIEQDLNRFKEIVRGRIKKDLHKFITKTELIGKKGKDLVSIPIPQIEIPHFIFGDNQKSGVGQGEGESGQSMGQGEGAGAQAGNAEGQHLMEVELSFEELAEILGEALELPRIEPKGEDALSTERPRYTSIGSAGPESLRHFKRTYRQALKRHIVSGTYNPKNPIIVPIREDRRYRMPRQQPKQECKAVIIYMMDVSGCHTAGHFVEMGDGSYKDISQISIGDKVACVDVAHRKKTTSVVTQTFKYDVSETVNIQTEDHVALRVTPHHKYFIYDETEDVIIEKHACDIVAGDRLILVNQFGCGAERSAATRPFGESEAYLFGVMLGDGHVTVHIDEHDSQKNSRYVMITDEDMARLAYYADCAHTAFGVKGIIKTISDRNRLFLNSVDLVEMIRRDMPSLCVKSRQRHIDPIIFRQDEKVRASFLRGLFDAEGTIAHHAVEMLSSSLALCKQVKLMLSYWGIRARITQYDQEERLINDNVVKAGTYYRLSINSKDAVIFDKIIGFGCKKKKAKLREIVQTQTDGINAMRSRYIPAANLKAIFNQIPSIEKIKSRLYEEGRNAFSYANIERMGQFATSEEQKNAVNSTLKEALLICTVRAVEKSGEPVAVYDITVDGHNNYIVDGVLSHNSMGNEQKEVVRLEAFWIDTWLRSQYKSVEMRYIIHDAVAREVDRETFFHTRESGGTIISSAYKMCHQLIRERYHPQDWNIYPFHFSDGDNWSANDTEECLTLLKNEILPAVNMFCYGQVESEYGSGQFLKDLGEKLKDNDRLITSRIPNKDAIPQSIKDFLGKGK